MRKSKELERNKRASLCCVHNLGRMNHRWISCSNDPHRLMCPSDKVLSSEVIPAGVKIKGTNCHCHSTRRRKPRAYTWKIVVNKETCHQKAFRCYHSGQHTWHRQMRNQIDSVESCVPGIVGYTASTELCWQNSFFLFWCAVFLKRSVFFHIHL